MKRRRVLLAIGMTVALLAVAACGGKSVSSSASSKGPIVIGATYEATGPVPTLGAEGPGAEAAAKYLNAHGGVLGRRVKIVLEDNAGDPSQAVSQLRQFSSQGVNLVLGGALGSDCDAEAPVATKLNQVVLCGATDTLPADDSHMFGIGPVNASTYAATAVMLAPYAKKVGVFANTSSDGADSARSAQSGLAKVGAKSIMERYPPTATNFTTEVQAAIGAGAQALWFTDCGPASITQVTEAASLGFKGKIALEGCLASSSIAHSLEQFAGNRRLLVLAPYSVLSVDAPSAAERSQVATYKSQVRGPVNIVETAGWDSMMVFAKAIEAAHSTSTSSVIGALNNNFAYTGLWQFGTFTSQQHQAKGTQEVPTYFATDGRLLPLQ